MKLQFHRYQIIQTQNRIFLKADGLESAKVDTRPSAFFTFDKITLNKWYIYKFRQLNYKAVIAGEHRLWCIRILVGHDANGC